MHTCQLYSLPILSRENSNQQFLHFQSYAVSLSAIWCLNLNSETYLFLQLVFFFISQGLILRGWADIKSSKEQYVKKSIKYFEEALNSSHSVKDIDAILGKVKTPERKETFCIKLCEWKYFLLLDNVNHLDLRPLCMSWMTRYFLLYDDISSFMKSSSHCFKGLFKIVTYYLLVFKMIFLKIEYFKKKNNFTGALDLANQVWQFFFTIFV